MHCIVEIDQFHDPSDHSDQSDDTNAPAFVDAPARDFRERSPSPDLEERMDRIIQELDLQRQTQIAARYFETDGAVKRPSPDFDDPDADKENKENVN